jgi:predicted metal-dependent peptidase
MLAKERITKIVEKWYLLEPLYFAVWTLHQVEPTTHIKTIKVQNGHIEYNPVFLDSLSTKDLESVLSFEAMRIILKHPYSRKKELAEIAYLASNITVQEYIQTTGLGFLSARAFFNSDAYDRKHFELYYDKIMELAQNTGQGEDSDENDSHLTLDKSEESSEDRNGESREDRNEESSEDRKEESREDRNEESSNEESNNEESREDRNDNSSNQESNNNSNLENYSNEKYSGYENACDWGRSEYQEQMINDKIKEIEIANSWGSITANIQEKILATLKPKINYKTILKSFRASILSNSRRLTRMKPSRRYGFLYMGSRRDFTTKLLFAVDVSGSVSHAALKNAFSILNRFFKYGIEEISVICFDSEIKGKLLTLKKAKKEINISGRGGTNFGAVIDFIDKDRTFDGVLIFTDGYAPCPLPPKNKKTKILWLFDTESNYKSCKSGLSKIGKVAFVKEN